jgi:hypothetical protein
MAPQYERHEPSRLRVGSTKSHSSAHYDRPITIPLACSEAPDPKERAGNEVSLVLQYGDEADAQARRHPKSKVCPIHIRSRCRGGGASGMRNWCPIATGPGVVSQANKMSELPCGGRVAQNSILKIWTVFQPSAVGSHKVEKQKGPCPGNSAISHQVVAQIET